MIKHSSFEMDGESRDLLLFDYLEGNLSAERAAMVEEALAHDPDLRAELEMWRESFVVQDFYATDALEAELLRKSSKPFSFSGSAAGFLVVLVTSMFSFIPVGEKEASLLHDRIGLPLAEVDAVQETDDAKVEDGETKAILVHDSAPHKSTNTPAAAAETDNILIFKQEELLPHAKRLKPEEGAIILVKVEPAAVNKQEQKARQPQSKKFSRKQERQVKRMKRKALQQKKANEFIKGNRPYVVPLDTQNF